MKTERSVDVNPLHSRWSDTSERGVDVNPLYSRWSGTSVGLCNFLLDLVTGGTCLFLIPLGFLLL